MHMLLVTYLHPGEVATSMFQTFLALSSDFSVGVRGEGFISVLRKESKEVA